MDRQSVQQAIALIDREVPRAGARVLLRQYGGGPDEGQFVANESGFLRFGIEFLKSALAEPREGGAVDVDLEYLVSSDSDIGFDDFQLKEMPEQGVHDSSPGLVPILIMSALAAVALLAVIGLVTVVGWIAA